MTFLSQVTAPIGPNFGTLRVRAFNRTGGATEVGQVVQFDITQSATETTDSTPGSASGAFANVVDVGGGPASYGFFGICEEVVADNEELWVLVQGRVEAIINDNSSTLEAGRRLHPQTTGSGRLLDIGSNAVKILAILLEEYTTQNVDATLPVLFDGIYGFK